MISVCLASYNGGKYIRKQIESILKQIGENDELIISDDGSTDDTLMIINSFGDRRIILFENQGFSNHIKNFNFCLSKAKGDYIFLSDQDDVWLDNKVKVMMEGLIINDLVLSNCILIDGDNEPIKGFEGFSHFNRTGFFKNFYKNCYLGCCMAFNRKVLKYSLPFPKYINSHDMWIGLVAEVVGKCSIIPDKLIYFRRHGKNFSANSGNDTFLTGKSPYNLNQIIASRCKLLFYILKVIIKKYVKK